MESFLNLLAAHYPTLLVFVVLLGLVIWVTVYIMKRINEISNVRKDIDNIKSVADCKSHHSDISDIKSAITKFTELMMAMGSDISYLRGVLGTTKLNNPLTESHSPIGLSEAGAKVALDMGVDGIINSNWVNISNLIHTHTSSLNAYDIQQYCIEASTVSLDKLFGASDIDKIKLFAYNEGQTLAYYGPMIGVLIRDKYFSEKDIPLGDIDVFAPTPSI